MIDKIDEMKTEGEKIFYELLEATRKVYEVSDIKKKNKEYSKNYWYYSVTATEIERNKPLIVGFNWGVDKELDKNEGHTPQSAYPKSTFQELGRNLGSLEKTINFFKIYYPDALDGMQTNFCFFRSETEDQISADDLKLCELLFTEYLNFANPTIIISFSAKLRNYMLSNKLLEITDKATNFKYVKYGRGKLLIVKANFRGANKKIPFVYIPHPNAHVSSISREQAWEFCFE